MGLKENVIVGRLIPAGTGRVVHRLRKIEGLDQPLTIDEEEGRSGRITSGSDLGEAKIA